MTGEESAAQVRLRAERTGALHPELYLAAAPFGSGDQGPMYPQAQAPAGNGDANIDAAEFVRISLPDLTVMP